MRCPQALAAKNRLGNNDLHFICDILLR